MDFSFNLSDLLSLIVVLAGVSAAFYKLSTRMGISEVNIKRIDRDVMENRHKIEVMDDKIESKLDAIMSKIEKINMNLSRIQGKGEQ